MRIINQSHEILWPHIWEADVADALVKRIEGAGRTCYKSEDKITKGSAYAFVLMLKELGHESVLEHEVIQVRFITDRGVTHELVRHRLAAYSQESTRYCDYGGDNNVVFISPVDFALTVEDLEFMRFVEAHYQVRRKEGLTPGQARYFLINGLKTEIVATFNIRTWRHIFRQRATNPKAHAQMQALMLPVLADMANCLPVLFDDLLM